jgi:hypothetical protein
MGIKRVSKNRKLDSPFTEVVRTLIAVERIGGVKVGAGLQDG